MASHVSVSAPCGLCATNTIAQVCVPSLGNRSGGIMTTDSSVCLSRSLSLALLLPDMGDAQLRGRITTHLPSVSSMSSALSTKSSSFSTYP